MKQNIGEHNIVLIKSQLKINITHLKLKTRSLY